MENGDVLHVAVFPWLAMGHLIPFLHLSKLLAQKGYRVSFLTTPKNILKLPKIPSDLSSLIHLVPLPFSHVPSDLPLHAESSTEVPYSMQQLLKRAFDSLQLPLSSFLRSSAPDWITYDYAPHWLPALASELGVLCAFFSLFNAANLAFIGPPSVLIDSGDLRTKAEDFVAVPDWVTFESHVVYREYEIGKYFEGTSIYEPTTSDTVRFGVAVEGSEVVVVRSSAEFEPEWFGLLRELYKKPVVLVGVSSSGYRGRGGQRRRGMDWCQGVVGQAKGQLGGLRCIWDRGKSESGRTQRVGHWVGTLQVAILFGAEELFWVGSDGAGNVTRWIRGAGQGSGNGLRWMGSTGEDTESS